MITDTDILEEAIRLIDEGVSVTLPVNGRSMLPFIIGGQESVILQKPAEVRKGQVVLAWVDGNRYVVHRVIAIDRDHLTLMGDGNLTGTEQCGVADVKALATHVVDAQGRHHEMYVGWRRQTARLWYLLRPLRRYLLAVYRRVYKK